MSRRRRSRNSSRRDPRPIANHRLPATKPIRRRNSIPRGIEDRRQFSPYPAFERPYLTKRSTPSRILYSHARQTKTRSKAVPASTYPVSHPAFVAPRRVLVCVRRQRRTEVLFALGKAGRKGQKRPRFSSTSNVSCKG